MITGQVLRYWRHLRAAGWTYARRMVAGEVTEWTWQAPDHWAGGPHEIGVELIYRGVRVTMHRGARHVEITEHADGALTVDQVIVTALRNDIVEPGDIGRDNVMVLADALAGAALVRGAAA